jgi:hypothetical protein
MDHRHPEQRPRRGGVVVEADAVAGALARRDVLGQEGDLERGAGAFHLGRRPAKDAPAAPVGEAVERAPAAFGILGAGVVGGDAGLGAQKSRLKPSIAAQSSTRPVARIR